MAQLRLLLTAALAAAAAAAGFGLAASQTGLSGLFRVLPLQCFKSATPFAVLLAEQRTRIACAAACLRRVGCSAFEFRTSDAACKVVLGDGVIGTLWTTGAADCSGATSMLLTSGNSGIAASTTAPAKTPAGNLSSTAPPPLTPQLSSKIEALIDLRRPGTVSKFADTSYTLSYRDALNSTDGAVLIGGSGFLMLTSSSFWSKVTSGFAMMIYAKVNGISSKRSNLMSISLSSTNPLEGRSLFMFSDYNSSSLMVECSPLNGSTWVDPPLAQARSFFSSSGSAFTSIGINFSGSMVSQIFNATEAVGIIGGGTGSGACLSQSGLSAIRIGWGLAGQGLNGTVGCFGLFLGSLTAADMIELTGWCTIPLS